MSGKKMLQTYKRKRPSSTYGLTQGTEKHGLPLDSSEAVALSPTNKAQHQKPEHDEESCPEIVTVNSDTSSATVCLKTESTSVEKGGSTCFEGNTCPINATDVAVADQSPCSNLSNMERSNTNSVGTVALNKASGLCREMQVKEKQQLTQGTEKHGLPLDSSEAVALSPTNKAQHPKPEHDEESCPEIITVNSETSSATVCLKTESCNTCPINATDVAVADQSPCSNLSSMERLNTNSVGTVALNKASGLCREMPVKEKQRLTPLITFIRRNKRKRDSLVSGSNQDLGLSKVSKLGIENHAAVFKPSVDNSKVGPFHNSDNTPTDISASGGTVIKEEPGHVSLHNSQASCSNAPKDCSLEDANNTQPANDPSFEPLIDDKSRRVSNEAMQMHDHTRKVELPCLNLSIAPLDQCGEMDGIDLNKESVQTEPLSGHPSGPCILQNEIPTLAVEEAPKNQYLQLFPETRDPIGYEAGEAVRFGTNTFAEQLSSRYPFLPIDPKIGENAYQTREYMQHLYSSVSSLDQGSLHLRHKLIIDSILGRSTWSEEELDFLWVGVRRYGRNNWEAMLRDPRMRFSPWRSPRELADRWEEEQMKLLSNMYGSQSKSSKPRRRFHTRRKGGSNRALLSLGDLYVKPNVSEGLEQIQHRGRTRKRPSLYKESYLRPDTRLFQFHHPTSTANIVTTTSLPHWLQEVTDRTGEPCLQPSGSGGLQQHHVAKQQDGVIVINSNSSSEETISDDNLS